MNDEKLKGIEKRLSSIERKLDEILRQRDLRPLPSPYPVYPLFPTPTANNCSKCGLYLNQTLGYVCGDPQCPCGLGGITC